MSRAALTAAIVRAYRAFDVPRRRRRRVPRAARPAAIEREYARALRGIITQWRAAFAPALEMLPRLLARAAIERVRTDAGESREAAAALERAAAIMGETVSTAEIEALAARFGRETQTFQRKQFVKQTRAVLGVDVLTSDLGLGVVLEGFVTENVALIKGIGAELRGKIEQSVTRAIANATPHPALARELEDAFGFAEDRAKLIANDQIGKAYAAVGRARNQEIGIRRYIWRTARDRRVRGRPGGKYPKAKPSHWIRDGKMFSYDAPPEGGHPGQAVRCRCFEEPLFDDILDSLGEAPQEIAPPKSE